LRPAWHVEALSASKLVTDSVCADKCFTLHLANCPHRRRQPCGENRKAGAAGAPGTRGAPVRYVWILPARLPNDADSLSLRASLFGLHVLMALDSVVEPLSGSIQCGDSMELQLLSDLHQSSFWMTAAASEMRLDREELRIPLTFAVDYMLRAGLCPCPCTAAPPLSDA